MTSIPSSDPLSTLRDTIAAIDREPGTLSPELRSLSQLLGDRLHRLEADAQSKATVSARAHTESQGPRAERGTLWVRPWGGK